MATAVDYFLIKLGLDSNEFISSLNQASGVASQAQSTIESGQAEVQKRADAAQGKIGEGAEEARAKTSALQAQMQQAGKEFDTLGDKWANAIKGFALNIVAPISAAFAIWKGISNYSKQVGEVARLTGAYSEKLEEWRKKRALLSRVTREDIELYKKGRESVVGFQIVMDDLAAKVARNFYPALRVGIEVLQDITKWIDKNGDNLARFFAVAGVTITTLFLPALVKMSAAILASPITWIMVAIGGLILVLDDLFTYMRGGETALSGFWSIFGTGEEIAQTLGDLWQWLKDTFEGLMPSIFAVGSAFAAFKIGVVVFEALNKAILAVKTALTALAAHPIIAVLVLVIALIGQLIAAFIEGGGTAAGMIAVIESKIGGFLDKLGPVGDAIRWLLKLTAEFFEYISNLWDESANIFDFVGNLFKDFAQSISGLLKNLGSLIIDAISNLPVLIKDIVGATGGFIADFVGKIIDGLVDNLAYFGRRLAMTFENIYNDISEVFSDLWDSITSYISNLIDDFSQFVDDVIAYFAAIPDRVTAYFSELYDDALNILEDVGEFISGVVDDVIEYFSNLPAQFLTIINDLQADLMAWLLKVPDAFREAFETVGNFVRNALQGVFEWVKEKIDWLLSLLDPGALIDKIKKGFTGAVDSVKNFFGIGGDDKDKEEAQAIENNAYQSQEFNNLTTSNNEENNTVNTAYNTANNTVQNVDNSSAYATYDNRYTVNNDNRQTVQEIKEPSPMQKAKAWAYEYEGANPSQPQQNISNTENISNAYYQSAFNTNTTNNSQRGGVTQNNNITINAGNADPNEIGRRLDRSLISQNEALDRQVFSYENGTRT